MRFSASLLFLAVLSGCTSDVTRLRELNPAADTFSGALAAEYRDLAGSEAEQGRRSAASHFARKGLRALQGDRVEPDALDRSFTGADAQAQALALAEARAQLMRLLTDEVKQAAPQELARAQLLFDCWQHQAVSAMAAGQALCAAEFEPALDRLLEKAGDEVYGQAFRRSIVFAPRATRLTGEHRAGIDDVVCQLSEMTADYWVELRAYVGRKPAQRKLTEARIGAVHKALVKAGVPARQIRVHREGARGVMLSRDNIPMNTKVVTITITADARETQ